MNDYVYLVFTYSDSGPLVYSVHKTLEEAEKDVEFLRRVNRNLRPYLDVNNEIYWKKYLLAD